MSIDRKKLKIAMLSGAVVVAIVIVTALANFGERSPIILQGTVKLAPELQEKAKAGVALYLIVRDEASSMPMPWGAMVTSMPSPSGDHLYEFTLTKENLRTMGDGAPPKTLRLKARVDLDGAGGADMPGDLTGEISGLAFGQEHVVVTIDKEVGTH